MLYLITQRGFNIMEKFKVTIESVITYEVEVEASDSSAAKAIALGDFGNWQELEVDTDVSSVEPIPAAWYLKG